MIDVAIAFFIGLVIGGCGGVFALALCIMSGKNEPRDDQKERLNSYGIRGEERLIKNLFVILSRCVAIWTQLILTIMILK